MKKNTHQREFTLFLKKQSINYLTIMLVMVSSVQAQFVHPGLWHKKSDLDRMKYMVASGLDPWQASFNKLKSDSKSSYDYVVRKSPTDNTLSRENPSHQRNEYESDAIAAYQNALMWYITGDARHANKAIEILNAWSTLVNFYGGGTEALSAGLYGAPLINAAEIIKNTYNGWSASDIQAFKDMLVYPGYSNTTVPQTDINNDNVTFYWRTYMGDPGRHGNQGLLAWRTVMAIGVFLDNQIIYDRALRQIQGLPHRADDLPYESGPALVNSTPLSSSNEYYDEFQLLGRASTIADYGYDDQIQHYIYDTGQCQESSRDQVHSSLGIGTIAEMMEVAWNQGTDIYSFLDNRLLKGLEYTAKYNLSAAKSFPEQTIPWEPTNYYQYTTRTGRWKSLKINPWVGADLTRNSRGAEVALRPVYEMQAAHFNIRAGKKEDALWTNRSLDYAIDVNGYEQGNGTDAPGWGGLTFRRPEGCAGDPITGFTGTTPNFGMNVLPGKVEAENFDFFAGKAEGRSYHDNTLNNSGAVYRTMDNVDIETTTGGGYNLTSIESGEWLTYTVSVPETAVYSFSIRYAASQAGGTMKLSSGVEDKTSDLAVPFGGVNSNGFSDWKDYIISSNVILNKGVQSFKIYFGGVSGAFKLDNYTLVKSGIVKQDQSIKMFTIPNRVFGTADYDPKGVASSGLAVSYTSSNTTVATIVSGKIHIVGTGKTTITATQEGDAYYNAAPSVSQELNVVNAIAGTITLSTIADSYVNGGAATTNYATNTSLTTKAASASSRYAYYKFDLSSVPGTIVSAKLRLYQRTSFAETRNIYDVTDDSWTETGLNWINKPAYNNERASILSVKSNWNEWDVSSYVAQEYANDKMITMVVNDPKSVSLYGIDYYSKEFGTNAPELVIQYTDTALNVKTEEIPLTFYPNPVVNVLSISLAVTNLNINETNITITSLNGQKVMQTKVNSSEVSLDLSKLSSGVYVVMIQDKSKKITQKIVKL